MPFGSGAVSFRKFSVCGESPSSIDQALLDKLAAAVIKISDLGVPEAVEYGWSGGQHLLDNSFTFDRNVYADCIHMALRIDTNKVPAALVKAWRAEAEAAIAVNNPSGFISKAQRREVKDQIRKKVDEEIKTGRYRKSRLIPVLWDVTKAGLYAPVKGKAQDMLIELFERTLGLELVHISSGHLGAALCERAGKLEVCDNFSPTRFVQGPDGEGQWPDYPWIAKGLAPKDFLGNEFLLWLWVFAARNAGIVSTVDGEATVMFNSQITMECAYGYHGHDVLKHDDPTKLPEAIQALRIGKLPRSAGLIIDYKGEQFTLRLDETLTINSAKLPEVTEAETARVLFEERIGLLRNLTNVVGKLFRAFLFVREDEQRWHTFIDQVGRFITEGTAATTKA